MSHYLKSEFTKVPRHLSFKGVPIDGTQKSFVKAMKKAGFKYDTTTAEGVSVLKGDFAGFKSCHIGVWTLDNIDVVYAITVIFPCRTTWKSLLRDYQHLKGMIVEKYGEASEQCEIEDPIVEGADFNNDFATIISKLDYYSEFRTELGKIRLDIIPYDINNASVRLSYFDKENGIKVRCAAIDEL